MRMRRAAIFQPWAGRLWQPTSPFGQRGRRPDLGSAFRGAVAGIALAAFAPLGALPGQSAPVASAAEAAHQAWHTSYASAIAQAEQTGRPILTVFTGSDWCPHCKTLEKNVLESGAFREWAQRNVVLLMIDLPEHGITETVRVERSKVCIKYGVRNFPAVLLLGPDGTKLAEKRGYQGQSPASWIADMAKSLPEQPAKPAVVSTAPAAVPEVLDSLDKAIESARGAKRPILLVVARPGDKAARSHSDSLISDPEFAPFVRENFIVAHVPPTASSGTQEAESMENLLGGVELAPDAVELIVTDDGQTPLFSQSGAQPPARIVHGLRRFLAARQASRFGETAPRR
jgi:thiol-disulfide isomerase/thioredoxin